MKKILLNVILFFALIGGLTAQNITTKLSPFTKKFLSDFRNNPEDPSLLHNYIFKKTNNGTYLSAVIKVNQNIDDAQLSSLGIKTGTKAGNIWTTQIPLENIEAFIHLDGIDYIQLDEPCYPALDFARIDTRVDSVHGGYNLPMPYNGEGIVMGVVDAGFDLHHPVFFDTSGTLYRVKKVWFQKDISGTPPSGFGYGTEFNDSASILNVGTDNGKSHGTHVSGICGGSGFGSPVNGSKFKGIAYKSDFVLVGITPVKDQWISTGVSDMIDGINYIFMYADSVGKPAVVNLSWASPLGPRDGTGLFSQAIDNLTGPGKIFVCAAGNNGTDDIHVQKTFTPSDTIVETFLDIATSAEGKKTWVDMWGDTGKFFCVKVSLYNGTQIASTGLICLDDSTHELALPGSNNDTCFVSIMTSASEFNMKPRIFIDFNNMTTNDSIVISLEATNGTVHFWNSFVSNTSGYYSSFKSNGYPWATDGDYEYTISDIASSKSAITVGAYASKTDWTNISNQTYTYSGYVGKGNLVPFSSHGPTTDGRIKPDITGPGLTVGSGLSSYDSTYMSTSTDYLFVINTFHDPNNNRDYPYGQLSGTSMSTPAVSGIAAMLLQAKSDLDPQNIKDIFSATAIKDNFTGIIPVGGNPTWGNGKVNAYGAIGKVLQIINQVKDIESNNLNCNLYPNPNDGTFILDYTGKENELLKVELFNLVGQNLYSENWQTIHGFNLKSVEVKNIESGIYFIKITSASAHSIIKMMITNLR